METNKTINNQTSWKYWIIRGIGWGIFMFIFMNFLYPFIAGHEINWNSVLISIPLWMIAGLLFGASMKFFMSQRSSN